ncbi:LysR substrate-binding domain-containing protein [Streptomyces sp. NPDC060028]|uniref:LysR substrate-binding domain-containing protein n=1 Tax=Streptomyces sp. NPDC060028 TaxID=3347041 RepID=UPI00369208F6
MCLASQPLDGPGLTSVEVLREEVLLAVPEGHRFAGREWVEVADLDGEPFVSPGPGNWQRALAERMFARAGARPRVVCEGNEPGAVPAVSSPGSSLRRAADQAPSPRTVRISVRWSSERVGSWRSSTSSSTVIR